MFASGNLKPETAHQRELPKGRVIDTAVTCTQVACMNRKTISIDVDVYRQIKRRQLRRESLSTTLRRVLEEERDPADYLSELFREYGGTGIMSDEGFARVRARQKKPPRSSRPARSPRADAA